MTQHPRCIAAGACRAAPAVPLWVHSPYTNWLSPADTLTGDWVYHVRGDKVGSLTALVRIDNITYSIMGPVAATTSAIPPIFPPSSSPSSSSSLKLSLPRAAATTASTAASDGPGEGDGGLCPDGVPGFAGVHPMLQMGPSAIKPTSTHSTFTGTTMCLLSRLDIVCTPARVLLVRPCAAGLAFCGVFISPKADRKQYPSCRGWRGCSAGLLTERRRCP